MKERFEAYRVALDANFMQPDEVRFAEDMEPMGMNWIKLGLQDVLYDPKTKQIYTPNTNQSAIMGENPLQSAPDLATMEENRGNDNHNPENGRFTSGSGGSRKGKIGKPKKAGKPRMSSREASRVTSAILTDHPKYKAGERRIKYHGDCRYEFYVNGPGDYNFISKKWIKGRKV